jgi:hypothetical protein
MILLLVSHDIRALFTKAWNLTKYSNTNSTHHEMKIPHLKPNNHGISKNTTLPLCLKSKYTKTYFLKRQTNIARGKKTLRALLKREFGCLLAFLNQITHGPWQKSQNTAEKRGKRQRPELKEKEQKTHKQQSHGRIIPTTKNKDWGEK